MLRNATLRLALVTPLLALSPARAGTLSLAWDPVTDADLVGYRIYWGTSTGSYTQQRDVGIVTEATLTGLADCMAYSVAVKARDAAGNLSAAFSNEVAGYPRPTLTTLSPAAAEQGLELSVTVDGANFRNGAMVRFGNPALTVRSVTVASCTRLSAVVAIAAQAAAGPTTLEVENPDGTFGGAAGLFTIVAAAPPAVVSATPADGATGVPVTVRPGVTFSEVVDVTSVTASTVRLLDATGANVPQAAGSPTLSASGTMVTLVPAAPLANDRSYRIEVVGVKDAAAHPMAGSFLQSVGFRTAADAVAPVISSVLSNARATSATITWTTDEDADGRVLYRKDGDTLYQQLTEAAPVTRAHSVTLQGLAPATSYAFHVTSRDVAGNTASSSDATLTTAASTYAYVIAEIESGGVATPARVMPSAEAFRGAFVDTPSGSSGGAVEIGLYAPADATWFLFLRLFGADDRSDGWLVSVDGGVARTLAPNAPGRWTWTSAGSFTLARGLHRLLLQASDPQARADRLLLTNDPEFLATEEPGGDVTPPAQPSGLVASAGSKQVTLAWTNPATDVAGVVVRFRTDDRVPATPADGLPALARSATSGTAESFVHSGLVNGTTYTYGVFVVDRAGNASTVATVKGTPVDREPPGTVGNVHRTDRR